jgi:ATP-dependent RNA helicase DDX52/ROK1
LNRIFTWGAEAADPFVDFKELDLPKRLLKNLKKADITQPTPIQMQAIPIMLEEKNVFACAPTGSGKTLAFVLPIAKLLLDNSVDGIGSIIVCPTNVLANQIFVEASKFCHKLPLEIALLEPGTDIGDGRL